MLKNYIKVALRNLLKHKGFSFINIVGLATGIACSVLIMIFVAHELSYDKFHEKSDRIHRLAVRASIGDTKIHQTYSSSQTFKMLLADFPEIETGVKFLKREGTPVVVGDRTFYEQRFFAVDETFFNIFSFPLIHGDPSAVLTEPNTMAISEDTAVKYFGSPVAAMGQVLTVGMGPDPLDFEITGVSSNAPDNSHFHYDVLVSTASFPSMINETGWTRNNFITYILLKEGVSAEGFKPKLAEFTRKYMGEEQFDSWVAQGNYWEYFLQPLTTIHLNSDLNGEFEANGNQTYVYIFSIVSLIILIIACINFMNLSTAKSSLRAKEVGLRKVVGSNRSRLVVQFLSESVILSLIALVLGIILILVLLPTYANMVGRKLHLPLFDNWLVLPSLLGLGLFVGLISGSYPAFFLSSFKPVTVFRGISLGSKGGAWLRNSLVIFQFTISIFLIIGTLVVNQQLRFFQNKQLGFDKEQVLIVRNHGDLDRTKVIPFKDTLRGHSSISQVSGSVTLPGKDFSNIGFGAEGVEQNFTLNLCICDYDFLETLKLEMIRGRFFSRDFPSDANAAVLNEKAAELLGWEDPLGKRINNWSSERGNFTVIGVVKDFHYESLHQDIRPQALFLTDGYYSRIERYISARLSTDSIPETLSSVETTWKQFAPGKPFEYSFLDKDFDNLYVNEMQTRKMFSVFSVLAVFIACLGLFGLASFVADRRTKEIGIRRILGASVPKIVKGLNSSFVKWVLLANVIAWPAAWFVMNRWLQNFAYRIDLAWWVFLAAGVLALAIALVTVSLQTVRAALKNPADSLRYQ